MFTTNSSVAVEYYSYPVFLNYNFQNYEVESEAFVQVTVQI